MTFLLLALVPSRGQGQSVNTSRSFEVENGILVSNANGDQTWMGACLVNPAIPPGLKAPIGSICRTDINEAYSKFGPLDTDWQLDGLGSNVVTQTADFGRNGNSTAGSFLLRTGSVPSNISGVTSLLSNANLKVVGCSQEDNAPFTAAVYYHDGNFVNPVLLYTLVSAGITAFQANLNIPIPQGKQLSLQSVTAAKNLGCTIGIKGTSI